MFNQKDTNQILRRGSTVKGVEEQIDHFRKGFCVVWGCSHGVPPVGEMKAIVKSRLLPR